MPRHQSKAQEKTVRRVMHEFKHGELESGAGGKVKNPKQAIAIALSEAGASKYASEETNRQSLRRTKKNERRRAAAGGNTTRSELYQLAKRRNIAGRSKMNKSELERALHG